MAKFENARLSYNNTDDPSREYDIYVTAVVSNGKVTNVENMQANRQGAPVASGSISGLDTDTPSTYFNTNSAPASEVPAVISALIGFATTLASSIDAGAANPVTEE